MGKSVRSIAGKRKAIFGWAVALIAPTVLAAVDDPFFDLNLNEVLDLEITSVSKKPQTVSRAAAAVFVLRGDDEHEGGTTLADTAGDLVESARNMRVVLGQKLAGAR